VKFGRQMDFDAINLNALAFKLVWLALLNCGFGTNATMVTKLFTVGQKGPKGMGGFMCKGCMNIY
jgi:hypothetical protein